MSRSPRLIHAARVAGGFHRDLLYPLLADEARFLRQRAGLVACLASEPLPFLPDLRPATAAPPPRPAAEHAADPLTIYWADLRRLPPTSREEEFILARAIELLRRALLQIILEDRSGAARAVAFEHLSPYSPVLESAARQARPAHSPSCAPEGLELLRQRLHELQAVQHEMVTRSLRLVPSAAKRYANLGVAWEDLIQEGNAALLRAVERYDWREGARFSHYATWWIQQGILKALSCQARMVRLPVYLAQVVHRVRAVQASSPFGMDPQQIARQARISVDRVERALAGDRSCLSLDRQPACVGDDGGGHWLVDQLADQRPPAEEKAPGQDELRRTMAALLDRLPSREARVLRLRFGLENGRTCTLEEVRMQLGVSRERVRQLQSRSLQRLSQALPRRALARFLEAATTD
ncbi:MAG: sigma-70 family RNA polymerase sigma factor [Planctomycetota bacterium]|nr:MAG: sigma-70 family RNA polymerase sigma factor [Planctomycetota bacterium]